MRESKPRGGGVATTDAMTDGGSGRRGCLRQIMIRRLVHHPRGVRRPRLVAPRAREIVWSGALIRRRRRRRHKPSSSNSSSWSPPKRRLLWVAELALVVDSQTAPQWQCPATRRTHDTSKAKVRFVASARMRSARRPAARRAAHLTTRSLIIFKGRLRLWCLRGQ